MVSLMYTHSELSDGRSREAEVHIPKDGSVNRSHRLSSQASAWSPGQMTHAMSTLQEHRQTAIVSVLAGHVLLPLTSSHAPSFPSTLGVLDSHQVSLCLFDSELTDYLLVTGN